MIKSSTIYLLNSFFLYCIKRSNLVGTSSSLYNGAMFKNSSHDCKIESPFLFFVHMLFMEYHSYQCLDHYFFYYILMTLIAPQKMGHLYFLQMTLIFLCLIRVGKEYLFNKTRVILDKVNNYMRCNLLHINIKKCCFMYFCLINVN